MSGIVHSEPTTDQHNRGTLPNCVSLIRTQAVFDASQWLHILMRKLAAVVGALAPVCLHATTLVALWTPEKILIGADSRVVLGQAASAEACKIAHSGSTWFAVAGLVADPDSGFSVGDLLRSSLDTP